MTQPAYGYFPGCSLRGTGAAYEESILALFQCLDLKLEELDDWNCCGATSYMCIDEGSAFTLSARNLSLAQRSGHQDLVTPCSACYLVLRKTQDYVSKYKEISNRVQDALQAAGLPPLNGVRVRHPLEVLYNDVGVRKLKSKMVRPWQGGRMACYYGCQLVRPYGEADDMHNPTRMDELLQAAGVKTVPYSLKTKCCGGSLTGTQPEVGVRLNYILLKEAARSGADAIVTVCPLCQYNLDAYQAEIRRESGENLDMPILYFSQVLGWSLGADPRSLGLNRCISGSKLVSKWFVKNPEKVESYV